MTELDLLSKANWLYPKGTVYNNSNVVAGTGDKAKTSDGIAYRRDLRAIGMNKGDGNMALYKGDKWAEVISIPAEYIDVVNTESCLPYSKLAIASPGWKNGITMNGGLYRVLRRLYIDDLKKHVYVLRNREGSFVFGANNSDNYEISTKEIYEENNKPMTETKYKGELKGFPTEVVEWMLDRQVAAGQERDATVFEIYAQAGIITGGFDWSINNHGVKEFCLKVISKRNFDLFFKVFPKPSDFNGKIKGWPKEIVYAMIQNQIKECNDPEKMIFESCPREISCRGGFDWDLSKEGEDFWIEVIGNNNHGRFFKGEDEPKSKFHPKAQEWLMDCQEREGNVRNISIFEKKPSAYHAEGGFEWKREGKRLLDLGVDIDSPINFTKMMKEVEYFDKVMSQIKEVIPEKWAIDCTSENLSLCKRYQKLQDDWNGVVITPGKSLVSKRNDNAKDYLFHYKTRALLCRSDWIGYKEITNEQLKSTVEGLEAENKSSKVSTRFSKGDYIVLIEDRDSRAFKGDHCYKQCKDLSRLFVEETSTGFKRGGWTIYQFKDKDKTWRYADTFEIARYDALGKPYNVKTDQVAGSIPKTVVIHYDSDPEKARGKSPHVSGSAMDFSDLLMYGTGGEAGISKEYFRNIVMGIDPSTGASNMFFNEEDINKAFKPSKHKNPSSKMVTDYFSSKKEKKQETKAEIRLPSQVIIYKQLKTP